VETGQADARTCGWCGADLDGKRRDAAYCDSTCRAHATRWRQSRSAEGDETLRSAATPPIQAIREEQEAAKSHWSQIVREGIIDVLRGTGFYHADDLDQLGIPDEHRNIIGSQTAKLVNQKWIEEAGRRKSVLPSRNGAKSGIYRLTELGREAITGVDAGTSPPCVDSGDTSSAGVPASQGPEGVPVPPDCASAGAPDPSLFELPSRNYTDPDQRAA
jgi:hypothetical protein